MIDSNEYYAIVDEKIELVEEMIVDLKPDLEKAWEISTDLFRMIEELKENFSKTKPLKSPN